jgi:hypothetical protein
MTLAIAPGMPFCGLSGSLGWGRGRGRAALAGVGVQIPYPRRPAAVAGDRAAAVRADRHRVDRAPVAGQGAQERAARG